MVYVTRIRVLWALLLLAGCSGNGNEPSPEDNTKDRQLILTHWVDNIIVPSYDDFHASFSDMVAKASAFSSAPGQSSLDAFRTSWSNAYLQWQQVELFEFGPADKYTLRNFFNIYPADVAGIEANIGNPSANLDLPAAYARQGFPALDYLINGVANSDAAILSAYTTDAGASERMAYLQRIVARMETLLGQVVAEWKGSYRDTFIQKTGLDIGSSFGVVVNAFVLHYERHIRSGKVGIPSGAAVGTTGTPHPEKIEAYYKRDISRDLAMRAHKASENFFNGQNARDEDTGPSLRAYLDALPAKDPSSGVLLSKVIEDQFAAVSGKLDLLSSDLHAQIQNDNQKMIDTWTAMQKLVRLLKVDMTSAMSITITYTDNDGD